MFTYSFFLNPQNDILHLRLINNSQKAEMKLGLNITKEELRDALSRNPKIQNAYLALTLKTIEIKILEVQMDMINYGLNVHMRVGEILNLVSRKLDYARSYAMYDPAKDMTSEGFLSFFRRKMEEKNATGTRELFRQCIRKIEKFCMLAGNECNKHPESLTFNDISVRWLIYFTDWLKKDGVSTNTRARYLKNIRTVINHAIDEGLTDNYPFRRFRIHEENTRKRSLSVEDLRRLFDYPVEEYQKFYLDMFKLSFMLIGINMADLYNLKEIFNGRIEYRRAKTGRLYSIKVEPEAMEIIKRWKGKRNLLCMSDRWNTVKNSTSLINKELKKIGIHEKLPDRSVKITPEFPYISTYWARHTWATIARRLKISVDDIALSLGHANGHKTTRIYIDEDLEAVDSANRRVLDYVLYRKE